MHVQAGYAMQGSSPRSYRFGARRGMVRNTSSFNFQQQRQFKYDDETVALLNRDPESQPDKDLLLQAYKDTLIITIKGIAAGMQNTG